MNDHLINSIDDVLLDFEALPTEAIALEPDHIERAVQLSSQVGNEAQQWQTYLNALALFGFKQWLNERALDIRLDLEDCSIFQPSYANAIAAVFNLKVGEFKLCLIAIGSLTDEEITMPRAVIDLPEFIAHFYVLLEIQEEQEQAIIRGFLRYDELVNNQQATHLQADSDGTYSLPVAWFECDPDSLLLYLRCLDPKAIPLPMPAHPATLSSLEAERRAVRPNSENILQQTERLAVNVGLWLRDELDNFAESLSWVLLPALASSNSLRFRSLGESPIEQLEAIVTKLERSGMSISLEARAAYRDVKLAGTPLRLYAVTWPFDSSGCREWTLLLVLGAQPGTNLPYGIKLCISDQTSVLVEQTLGKDSQGDYLYARVVGTWDEKFVANIALMNGEALTLPPFTFHPDVSI